ncbi:O-antigen ligase family protein [Mariniblastus sp.]|nr:O-antigen ligase family protein [Mariniblastus sp.]
MKLFHLYFFFIFLIACTSAAASTQDYGMNSAFKTGGLIVVFSSLMFCSGYYSGKDLRNGLILYAIIELSLLYFTWSEWNPNAVASRAATAAITSYILIPSFVFSFSLLLLGLTIAFRFQSRTVFFSMVFSYFGMFLFSKMRKHSSAYSVALVVVFIASALFAVEGLAELRKYAKSSLNSQGQLAQFFLSDKNEKDIDGDFFDRMAPWSSGLKNIQKHPALGVGLDNESKAQNMESHSAYISLAVEGGLPSLLIWLLVYLEIGKCLFSIGSNVDPTIDKKLKSLAAFLFIYLILSGFLEKSGIGSILAPNNIICCFVAFWSIQQHAIRSHNSRQQAGSFLKQ